VSARSPKRLKTDGPVPSVWVARLEMTLMVHSQLLVSEECKVVGYLSLTELFGLRCYWAVNVCSVSFAVRINCMRRLRCYWAVDVCSEVADISYNLLFAVPGCSWVWKLSMGWGHILFILYVLTIFRSFMLWYTGMG
jgi:hypothetical protein